VARSRRRVESNQLKLGFSSECVRRSKETPCEEWSDDSRGYERQHENESDSTVTISPERIMALTLGIALILGVTGIIVLTEWLHLDVAPIREWLAVGLASLGLPINRVVSFYFPRSDQDARKR